MGSMRGGLKQGSSKNCPDQKLSGGHPDGTSPGKKQLLSSVPSSTGPAPPPSFRPSMSAKPSWVESTDATVWKLTGRPLKRRSPPARSTRSGRSAGRTPRKHVEEVPPDLSLVGLVSPAQQRPDRAGLGSLGNTVEREEPEIGGVPVRAWAKKRPGCKCRPPSFTRQALSASRCAAPSATATGQCPAGALMRSRMRAARG